VVELPDPIRSPDDVVEAIDSAMTPRTKLVVVDHVTADTALVMPVAKIAAACQRRRVPVLVDGAHAPGSIALDIAALGVDWYAANLHKWAHAPRACGLLWAAAGRQAVLHAPVISWGHRVGFREEFELNGTGDPTAYLAAPEGLAMLQEWGFERVVAYMHGLAWDAARLLTARWGTAVPAPREMVGAMVSVPLPEAAGTSSEDAARLRLALLMDDAIEVHMHAWRGRVWTRVSAQIYNELPDVERLASAIERRLAGKSPAS
jgi:isopenicillin-N epimerase